MLSRVANSVYWMNRYIERAENVARFIDVNLNLTLDLGDSMKEQWGPLVATTGDRDAFEKKFGQPTRENVWDFLTFDLENPRIGLAVPWYAVTVRNARRVAVGGSAMP